MHSHDEVSLINMCCLLHCISSLGCDLAVRSFSVTAVQIVEHQEQKCGNGDKVNKNTDRFRCGRFSGGKKHSHEKVLAN